MRADASSTDKHYVLEDFLAICGHQGGQFELPLDGSRIGLPWHQVDCDGVWLRPIDHAAPDIGVDQHFVRWHPRGNFKLPALPVPFTAGQLAAFMLNGGGLWLRDSMPTPSRSLLPNARDAREAIVRSRCLCRQAQRHFGCAPTDFRSDEKDQLEPGHFREMDREYSRRLTGINEAAQWLLNLSPAPRDSNERREPPKERAERRLARFEQLGGAARKAGASWQLDAGKRGILARLTKEEAAGDRPMKNKTDVRKDLQRALDAREKVRQAGDPMGGERVT